MRHVLIIEDMYLFQEYLRDITTLAGATSVSVVGTQREAIASALARKPVLILSDMKLPEGSGARAIDLILAAQGPIPVLYITGYPERCELHAAGDAVLTKPVPADILLRSVAAFLNRPPPRAPLPLPEAA